MREVMDTPVQLQTHIMRFTVDGVGIFLVRNALTLGPYEPEEVQELKEAWDYLHALE